MIYTMAQIKRANPQWFDKGNKKFFEDMSYQILHKGKRPFLVRSTMGWINDKHWVINPIDPETGKIKSHLDQKFYSFTEVKEFLKKYTMENKDV